MWYNLTMATSTTIEQHPRLLNLHDADPVRLEALFIRHNAAMKLRMKGDIDGYEALAFVLLPTPDVLEASLEEAERRLTERCLAV